MVHWELNALIDRCSVVKYCYVILLEKPNSTFVMLGRTKSKNLNNLIICSYKSWSLTIWVYTKQKSNLPSFINFESSGFSFPLSNQGV